MTDAPLVPLVFPEDPDDRMEWRLVRVPHGTRTVIETIGMTQVEAVWLTTDHPAIVACVGLAPACADQGCQLLNLQTKGSQS